MKRNGWIACAIISGIAAITPLWPIGIPVFIISLVKLVKSGKVENRLVAQIDLIARQLGIEYGSAEEKLEQIAKVAARSYTDREDGAE